MGLTGSWCCGCWGCCCSLYGVTIHMTHESIVCCGRVQLIVFCPSAHSNGGSLGVCNSNQPRYNHPKGSHVSFMKRMAYQVAPLIGIHHHGSIPIHGHDQAAGENERGSRACGRRGGLPEEGQDCTIFLLFYSLPLG